MQQLEHLVEGRRVATRPGCRSGTAGRGRRGRASEASWLSRARIQLRLPLTVLISPLCAISRYGWASGQRREGVGREARVHQRQLGGEPLVGQVGEERLELPGGEHALVDEGARRQRREVDLGLALGALAQAEGEPVELDAADGRAVGARRRAGGRAACTSRAAAADQVGRDGHVAPGEDPQALLGGDVLDAGLGDARARRRRRAGRPCRRRRRPPAAGRHPSTARKKASGTWVRMPAPSPTSGSAPVAPRWSRLRSASRAWSTMSWPAVPRIVATMATPQASCSCSRRYRPVSAGWAEKRATVTSHHRPRGRSAAEGDRARQGQARTALATSAEGYRQRLASCHLSRAIPHPGTPVTCWRLCRIRGGSPRRPRRRAARRPVYADDPDAQEEHDDAGPDVEPQAEDQLGLVGAHLLDDDPPDRVAGHVEREQLARGRASAACRRRAAAAEHHEEDRLVEEGRLEDALRRPGGPPASSTARPRRESHWWIRRPHGTVGRPAVELVVEPVARTGRCACAKATPGAAASAKVEEADAGPPAADPGAERARARWRPRCRGRPARSSGRRAGGRPRPSRAPGVVMTW